MLAVQFERALGQAVAKPADGRTKERGAGLIALDVIEAQYHVGELTVFVRYLERLQYSAVGDDRGLHAMAVTQHVLLDGGAVIGFAEGFVFAGPASGMSAKAGHRQGEAEAGKQESGLPHDGATFYCC